MQGPVDLKCGAGWSGTPQLAWLARCIAHTHTAVKPRFGIPNIWQGRSPTPNPSPGWQGGQGVLRKSEPGRCPLPAPEHSRPHPGPRLVISHMLPSLTPGSTGLLSLAGETASFASWVGGAGAAFRPKQKLLNCGGLRWQAHVWVWEPSATGWGRRGGLTAPPCHRRGRALLMPRSALI